MKNFIIKITKYAGTNGVAFVADFTVLFLVDYFFNFNRAYVAFFCYLLGTCVSFVLAKRYVFEKGWLDDKPTIEFFAYFLGGVIGAVITALMFILLIKIGVENILIQKIIASIFSFITVFISVSYTHLTLPTILLV